MGGFEIGSKKNSNVTVFLGVMGYIYYYYFLTGITVTILQGGTGIHSEIFFHVFLNLPNTIIKTDL